MKTFFVSNNRSRIVRLLVLAVFIIPLFTGGMITASAKKANLDATLAFDCTDPIGCVTIAPTAPIHIAYALVVSGPSASLGIDSRNGVKIAIADSGGKILGHTIKFDGQDTHCTADGGLAAGTALAADPTIVAIVGTSCSAEAREAMPLISAAGMSMVSPSNTFAGLTEPGGPYNYPGYLRVSWNDNIQGAAAAQFAYLTANASTAATISDGGFYSTNLQDAFAAEFAALGGTITDQVLIDPGQTDMTAELTDIAANSPDLIFMPIFMPEGGHILNQIGNIAGLETVKVLGSDGLWTDEIVTVAGANVEGFKVTGNDFSRQSYRYHKNFLPAYEARFGAPTSSFHAHAYDAFMMIKAAIEQVAVVDPNGTVHIGRQALRDALYSTTEYSGLTGILTCSATGDCADPHIGVYEYHTGEFPPTHVWPTRVGLVVDGAGIADLTFNYMAYQGLLRAEENLGVDGLLYEPVNSANYENALQQCAMDGNDVCIGVGFAMADAIQIAASANPGTKFVGIDTWFETPPANVRGMMFDERQAGYLAGVLAAEMSSTGDIGVVAGMEIRPVIEFVEGYRNGAQCSDNNVDVLMNYTGTFTDPDLGATVAADMLSRGADVIFGAAGETGNGAILYSAQHNAWSIGVDADQYMTVFGNGSVPGANKILTSAQKRIDNGVYATIEDVVHGTFSAGMLTYRLADDGVGLAPFHETEALIPQEVKDDLDEVRQGIIDGSIDVNDPCRPRIQAEIVENDVQGVDWLAGSDVTLTIDDPSNGPGVDFTDTQAADSTGSVLFHDLGGLSLSPGMIVSMTNSIAAKEHTITDLTVTGVDPATDTVWGTGTPGTDLNIQHCDQTGCSWRRWVTVQPDNSWLADFSVPGGSTSEEENLLDILPGMNGEALEPDDEADSTDYQWHAPNKPGAFKKSSPLKGALNQPASVLLEWQTSAEATSYEYCYDTTNDNTCALWVDNGASTNTLLVGTNPNTTYYWQVRAKNITGITYANGSDTAFWSFKTKSLPGAFSKSSPVNNALAISNNPGLRWSASTGANGYEYCVDTTNDNACDGDWIGATGTGVTLNNLANNTTYYWQVRAFNIGGIKYANAGTWWKFTVHYNPPLLVSPGPGEHLLTLRPAFDWQDVNEVGVSGYRIQISKNSSFTQIIHTGNATDSEYVPTVNLPKNATLYWRVSAKGTNGPSSYSDVLSFVTPVNPPPTPVLLLPANNVRLTTYTDPVLKWKPVTYADASFQYYQVQVADNSAFVAPVLNNVSVTSRTTGQLATALTLIPNTKYYWRVRAVNMDDEVSNWSTVWTIRAAILPPTLLAPADEATGVARKPLLSWENVPGNTGYVLQVWKAGTTPVLVKTVTLLPDATQYQFITNLLPNTKYFWKVQTKGSIAPSAWSQFDFTTIP